MEILDKNDQLGCEGKVHLTLRRPEAPRVEALDLSMRRADKNRGAELVLGFGVIEEARLQVNVVQIPDLIRLPERYVPSPQKVGYGRSRI